MVEWVGDDQNDIQIKGVEASRGSAPQRSMLRSWRQSRGSAPLRRTTNCSLERSGVVMDVSMQDCEESVISCSHAIMPWFAEEESWPRSQSLSWMCMQHSYRDPFGGPIPAGSLKSQCKARL